MTGGRWTGLALGLVCVVLLGGCSPSGGAGAPSGPRRDGTGRGGGPPVGADLPGTSRGGGPPVGPDLPELTALEPDAVPPDEAGLPVIELAFERPPVADGYGPVSISYRGRRYEAEAKLRGRSSLEYPKNSYTLKFRRDDPFIPDDRGPDARARRRLVLITTFDDSSSLRQRLTWELWGALGPVPLETWSAVVYLNGRYHGLYTVVDHVNPELFAAQGIPTGDLYKAVDNSAHFWMDAALETAFEKEEGEPAAGSPGAFDELESFVRFVSRSSDRVFGREVARWLDVDSYGAWLILATAACTVDSLAKNAYHHRDPAGLWRAIPWDFNASWGQHWDTSRVAATTDPLRLARDHNLLFRRLLADPVQGPALRARYQEALAGPLALPRVLERVDRLASELAEAARRDEAVWGAAHRAFYRGRDTSPLLSFSDEVAYLRRWIIERWALLDRVFAAE